MQKGLRISSKEQDMRFFNIFPQRPNVSQNNRSRKVMNKPKLGERNKK